MRGVKDAALPSKHVQQTSPSNVHLCYKVVQRGLSKD